MINMASELLEWSLSNPFCSYTARLQPIIDGLPSRNASLDPRKVFTSCGKYLSKTVSSLIKMYSASVGLQQFSEIMNWPERSTVGLTRILHDAGGQEIIFERESSTSGRWEGSENA